MKRMTINELATLATAVESTNDAFRALKNVMKALTKESDAIAYHPALENDVEMFDMHTEILKAREDVWDEIEALERRYNQYIDRMEEKARITLKDETPML